MLKNYITIAVRHLTGHKLFSIITVCCLAMGITFAMIIGLYVRNQERVNGTIRDVSNQYMIKSRWKVKGLGMDITTIPPLAKTMKEEYPRLVANAGLVIWALGIKYWPVLDLACSKAAATGSI